MILDMFLFVFVFGFFICEIGYEVFGLEDFLGLYFVEFGYSFILNWFR